MMHRIVVFASMTLFGVSMGGYAPRVAPQLPKDWCAEMEGSKTMSTGECMCRYKCEGKQCQSGQGMIWYAYKDCPTGCKCLPRSPQSAEGTPFFHQEQATEEVPQCSEEKPSCGDDSKTESGGDDSILEAPPVPSKSSASSRSSASAASSAYDDLEEDNYGEDEDYARDDDAHQYGGEPEEVEEPVSAAEAVMDWLDENYRLLFGGAAVLLLSCVLIPTLAVVGLGGGKKGGGEAAATAAAAAVVQKPAQPTAGSEASPAATSKPDRPSSSKTD